MAKRKQKQNHADVHEAADFYEPRLAKAFITGMKKLQASISIAQLVDAIEHRSHVLIPVGSVRPAMRDVTTVIVNASARGVELGQDRLRKALKL